MITVHHLENSRSQRVLWLLEELGVPYDVKRYARDRKTMLAPKELEAVHPLGRSPVITDGDLTVAETAAIVEYLVDRYGGGRFVPARDTPEFLRYRYWMHAAEGSMMPPLVMTLVFTRTEGPPVPFFLRPVTRAVSRQVKSSFLNPAIEKNLRLMEAELGKSEWFAGEQITGADFVMIFPVEAVASRLGLSGYPKLQAYLERVHSRDGYRRALERGGPYQLLG